MKLLSVNIGSPRRVGTGGRARRTAIHKTAAPGPVVVSREGLTGDAVCNVRHHGGEDQAVYVYSQSDYEWWAAELGRALGPGTFGENLTIGDLETSQVSIGDRFVIGSVVLEVTAPRIPCGTLSQRMDDPGFAESFRQAERPGFYCRVIREGCIRQGDSVEYRRSASEIRIRVLEVFRAFYAGDLDEATLRRHLAAPIAIRDRIAKEKQLEKLLASRS